MIAYCYASGLIRFGNHCPDGAIALAWGRGHDLREFYSTVGRHAYDARLPNYQTGHRGRPASLLVPGVPEAFGQMAKADALSAFHRWTLPMFQFHGLSYAP